MNDGIFDPAIWYRSMIDYTYLNSYRLLANKTFVSQLTAYYDAQCKPRLDACYATGSVPNCYGAVNPCQAIISQISAANNNSFSKNDVRQAADGIFPPETYAPYLYRADVQRAIGARVNYTLRSFDVLVNMTNSGDCESHTYSRLSL